MKILALSLIAFTLFSAAIRVHAQEAPTEETVTLISARHAFKEDALEITFSFNRNISEYSNTANASAKLRGKNVPQNVKITAISQKDKSSAAYSISADPYDNAESIEFSMTLRKEGIIVFRSPAYFVDVSSHNRLRRILKSGPTTIRFKERLIVADDRIGLRFITDNPGKIQVTISGPDDFKKIQRSPAADNTHNFLFTGLLPGTKYRFKAEALQFDDESRTIPKVSEDTEKIRETFITTNQGSPQVIIEATRKNPDNIVIIAKSNQKVFAEITYSLVLDNGGFDNPQKIASTNCDSFTGGGCEGPEVVPAGNASKAFTIPNLESGKTYKVELAFKNEQGKPAVLLYKEYTLKLPEPNLPTNFDFSEDPIIAKVTPLGIEVKWAATDKPSSASALYLRDNGSVLTGAAKTEIVGKEVTATFPYQDVAAIIRLQQAPTLEISMSRDNKLPFKRRIKFAFSLPSEGEVRQAAISQDSRDAILKVIRSVKKDNGNNGNSVKWVELLKTGLLAFLTL